MNSAEIPDCLVQTTGCAGRITLNRPNALNALTHAMCLRIEDALLQWVSDPEISLILIEATGDRAFCAGGDVVDIYKTGCAGDYDYARRFWRDEYRLNALIATYPKPIVVFMQGFTMGGGVGIACHAAHRIVCETSQVALPEVTIGLVPDVGSTALLASAPGALGAFIGTTAARLGPGCAIHAGFADDFVPQESWPDLITALQSTGDPAAIRSFAVPPPPSPLRAQQAEIARLFETSDLPTLKAKLAEDASEFARSALTRIDSACPLAVAAALKLIEAAKADPSVPRALEREYRFTSRAAQHGDFLEGIRAAIIDRDKSPAWTSAASPEAFAAKLEFMLSPLAKDQQFLIGDG